MEVSSPAQQQPIVATGEWDPIATGDSGETNISLSPRTTTAGSQDSESVPAQLPRMVSEISAAASEVEEHARDQSRRDAATEEDKILSEYRPYVSRCMSLKQLRKHRAELLSVRDILVHGDAWMVCRLLAADNKYTCEPLQKVLKISSGATWLREKLHDTPEDQRDSPRTVQTLRERDGMPTPATRAGRRSRDVERIRSEGRLKRSPNPVDLKDVLSPTVQPGATSPDRSSKTMSLVDESVYNQQAETAEDFIHRYIRPNIVTLSTVNKMLEEVEHAMAAREKLEITALVTALTGLYAVLTWLFTEVFDIDDDLAARWHAGLYGSESQ